MPPLLEKTEALREKRNARTICFILFLAIIASAIAIAFSWAERQKAISLNAAKNIRSMLASYQKSKVGAKDTWWLETIPTPNKQSFDLLQSKGDIITFLLLKYGNVSAETRQISNRFNEIIPGILVNGIVQTLTVNGKNTETSRSIAVCYVPHDQAKSNGFLAPFWYPKANAVLIPAIDIPDALYAGMLFHELGHAFRHNRFEKKSEVPTNNNERMAEEVAMYEFDETILDATSHGAFLKRVNEIVGRMPNETRFEMIAASVNHDDLRELDRMFGCADTLIPSSMVCSECALAVSLRFCDVHDLGSKKKIKVYQWFETNVFSPVIITPAKK
jgi:hypothetical protein